MKAVLFYFSGTGNALWAARQVSVGLGGAEVVPMVAPKAVDACRDVDMVGLFFPVHIWCVPGRVLRFVEEIFAALSSDAYLFAVAVNGGQVSGTLLQLNTFCRRRNRLLHQGLGLRLPSNYLPWGGAGSTEVVDGLIAAAREKIHSWIPGLRERQQAPPERGPLWQRLLFTGIYHLSFKQVSGMDRHFRVDDRCTRCGVCVRVCPADNIRLGAQGPVWQHRCTQCLACAQWCPQQAIQMNARTSRFPRYHHPEVRLDDFLGSASSPDPTGPGSSEVQDS